MNTENTKNSEDLSTQSEVLVRFFSPKTVEEQFLLEKFSESMIKEVKEFIPFFTQDDAQDTLSCTSPKNCLYIVAGIIHRIQ